MHGWTYKYTHAHKGSCTHARIWIPEDALYFSMFILPCNNYQPQPFLTG